MYPINQETEPRLNMLDPGHRALVLRTYLALVAAKIPADEALDKAPDLALARWREGRDWPTYPWRRY